MKDRFLFENNFDDQIFLEGEKLYESNGIKDVQILEKGLYILLIKDEQLHETEVLHPFTTRQKFTCDCSNFKTKNSCAHIVAALFELRKKIQKESNKKKSPKVEKSKKSKNSRLNTSLILDNIDYKELKSFILSYANKNQKFATAIKVNFASKIDLEDNYQKYKQLLDGIIRPITSKTKKVGAADIKTLINVCKDLNDQYQDAIALNQFTEAFIIAENVLKKIEYTKYNYSLLEKELNQVSKLFHSHFITLLNENIAPELKLRIQKLLVDISTLSYYQFDDPLLNVTQIVKEYTKVDEKLNAELKSIIRSRLENFRPDEDSLPVLYALLQQLSFDDSKAAISINSSHIKYSVEIIDNLIKIGALEQAEILIVQLLSKDQKNKNLHFKYLELLILQDNLKLFILKASETFIQFKDFRIIDAILKSMNEKLKVKTFKNINKELTSNVDYHFRAKYYLKIQDMQSLLELVDKQKDLRFLMTYDKHLIEEFSSEIKDLYKKLIEEYLDLHLGKHSTEFITEISYHLQNINALNILKSINSFMLKNYSHRLHFITSVK